MTESVLNLKQVCDYCTCSEISDIESSHLVLNILCSEFDRTAELSDLDKIAWPPNPNGLKISASFEGIGLSTLGKYVFNLFLLCTVFFFLIWAQK